MFTDKHIKYVSMESALVKKLYKHIIIQMDLIKIHENETVHQYAIAGYNGVIILTTDNLNYSAEFWRITAFISNIVGMPDQIRIPFIVPGYKPAHIIFGKLGINTL